MKIEIAKHERMSESGSSLLRLIQNENMPLLDLLVREAVQNSLDAGKPNACYVNVDIGVKSFKVEELAKELEGIGETLIERFMDVQCKCLYIEDSNTTGLTGPLSIHEVKNNDFGNLQKLVYEISKPQRKEGSGGSWGLGKTIYFRLGIGLVFYYSRIEKEGNFEHRLAATMVENEESSNSIIPSVGDLPKRGIAWWGEDSGNGTTLPITNEEEIKKVLDIFDISMFTGAETGTKIIIPFINEQELLKKTMLSDDRISWWHYSVDDYLKIAFQRWYAPRLDNQLYKYGNYLKASVSGKVITYDSMEIIFRSVQDLYNKAVGKEIKSSSYADKINVEAISIRRDFVSTDAGNVAFVKLNVEDLKMLPPENNPSPYEFLNIRDRAEAGNCPIICYTRKPGMILNYEISGPWLLNVENTGGNEFLLAIYVPNSELKLKEPNEVADLEGYLRKGEKADHTAWYDINLGGQPSNIVHRISKSVSKKIAEAANNGMEKEIGNKKSRLGAILGRQLMPPANFGNKATSAISGKIDNGRIRAGRSQKKSAFALLPDIIYEGKFVTFRFELYMRRPVNVCRIELNINSEIGLINGEDWEQEIIKKFPFEVSEVKINRINGIESFEKNIATAKLLATSEFNTTVGIEISKEQNLEKLDVLGEIRVEKHDEGLELAITPRFLGD